MLHYVPQLVNICLLLDAGQVAYSESKETKPNTAKLQAEKKKKKKAKG